MAQSPRQRARGGTAAPLRPGDTAQDAYVRLRDLIIDGAYLPGQRLPQGPLMASLGVGRTPLRTALSRLEGDGLVVATPNHGVVVAPASLGAGEEIYALRFLVEPPLLQAQASRISAGDVALLRSLLERMEACLDDAEAFATVHRAFHTVERQSFTNPFIDELATAMYRHLHRHQRIHAVRQRYPQDFLVLDRLTVDALEARDGLVARRILELHLLDAGIAFVQDVDPSYVPGLLLDVARANGVEIAAAADAAVPRGTPIRWTIPCPRLPALHAAYLAYAPA
ncbi:MAG TPA: GntR family transcriptional regulator [Gaiellaceae bacterium]|nr:GntR family transcriptional regulator [Gaiellaceae bacterium]